MKAYRYDKAYDVIVIGAGHAGVEAALASARLGCETLILTIDMDKVGHMPCNPAIGGLAKGHLVREIDAMGGEMGKATDATGIQFKVLNRGRGPAVWAPRAQCDRHAYIRYMKQALEKQERCHLKQALVDRLIVEEGKVVGVITKTMVEYRAKAVIVTTGTFLRGLVHIGMKNYESGRGTEAPSRTLSDSLRELGFELTRFKTGTTPRLDKRSIDFSRLERQDGDDPPPPFSFTTKELKVEQMPCWIAYTNDKTHEIIKANLDRSPLFSGNIQGVGPRYCPSIEDKVVRFSEKPHHRVFFEPEGRTTYEYYCNGLSTSLPEDVQISLLRTIPGMEEVEVMRPGYAIEYDLIISTQLHRSLETKLVPYLYCAGQINGTSGYEEAAAQGFMAGINAARKLKGQEPVIIDRATAYIGVLIDDLVTIGTNEPYRLFTSRAEYRLLIRQENADLRLTPLAREIGLIDDDRYAEFEEYRKSLESELQRLKSTSVHFDPHILEVVDADNVTEKEIVHESGELSDEAEKETVLQNKPKRSGNYTLYQLLKRPEIGYEHLDKLAPSNGLDQRVKEEVGILAKYDGYIQRQEREVERFRKLETVRIPEDFDYEPVKGLLTEAKEKFIKVRPETLGQAGRIPGVTMSDVAVLHVMIEGHKKKGYGKRKVEKE